MDNLLLKELIVGQEITFQVRVYLYVLGNVLSEYMSSDEVSKILSAIITYGDDKGWFDVRKIAKKILEDKLGEPSASEIISRAGVEYKKVWAPARKKALVGLIIIILSLVLGVFIVNIPSISWLTAPVMLMGALIGGYVMMKGKRDVKIIIGDL